MRGFRAMRRGFHHSRGAYSGHPIPYSEGTYRVVLKVSDREYTGAGTSPQSARHDAATQALNHIRELMAQDEQEHGKSMKLCLCDLWIKWIEGLVISEADQEPL